VGDLVAAGVGEEEEEVVMEERKKLEASF